MRCNGPVLASKRLKAGLTQEELAEKAGLKLRTITKAEASDTMGPATIHKIVTALCACGEDVNFDALVIGNNEIVSGFLSLYLTGRSSVDGLAHGVICRLLGPAAELGISHQTLAFSVFRTQLLTRFERIDDGAFAPVVAANEQQNEILVYGMDRLRNRASGDEITVPIMFRLATSNGEITEIDILFSKKSRREIF